MLQFKEIGLFLILMIAVTPLAFLLMPIIAATCLIGGLVILVVVLLKRSKT